MSFEERYSKDNVYDLATACEEVCNLLRNGPEEDLEGALGNLCLNLPQGIKSYYYLKIRSRVLEHIELLAKKASDPGVMIDDVIALTNKIHELTVALSKL